MNATVGLCAVVVPLVDMVVSAIFHCLVCLFNWQLPFCRVIFL